MKTRPCNRVHIVEGSTQPCPYPAMKRKQSCEWHWLQTRPALEQQQHAEARLAEYDGSWTAHVNEGRRATVPKTEWPPGERWCAGCQSFVPLFYTRGSRCKSCASTASHRSMVKSTYGLEDGEYDALLELQGGVCYVCRRPTRRRLAVDHDHVTGEPRGLLCADPEHGCNHAVLGSLSGPGRDELAQAKRLVEYLEHTPYERLRGIEPKLGRIDPAVRQRVQAVFQDPPF